MGLDVVSGGELYTAVSGWNPLRKICFHGNNKTASELVAALEYGVGTIVVDNLEELEMLDRLAASKKHLSGNYASGQTRGRCAYA